MKIRIINGPNLNLLGIRNPEVYGSTSFEDYLNVLKSRFPQHELSCFQSNHEGELVEAVQACLNITDAIIINAGGYTHTSVAIGDALSAVGLPSIEVHISHVYDRETFRHESRLSHGVLGVITGFGLDSYRLAIEALSETQR
ncbi:MAG: 3-dehydroquinate dehydratase [Flavobacteriales bacterium]|nr:3-dehydroquinate dehydratase [Flavobacteriales bacterium]